MNNSFLLFLFLFFLSLTTYGQELLTLGKAMEIAESYSSRLQESALNLERSYENLKVQEASLKSNFKLRLNPFDYSNELKYDDRPGGSGWYNVQRTTSGGNFSVTQPILLTDATLGLSNSFKWQNMNGQKSFYNNLNLRLDQPLFSHNQRKLALKEVKLDVENAELNYALQRLSMERSVTSQFYSVYRKQMQLLIHKEEYANQLKNHEIVEMKSQAGLMQLEELYQSEVNLKTSENAVEKAQVELYDVMDDFRVLIGVDFNYDFNVVLSMLIDTIVVENQAAIDRALSVSNELRQREINIEIAEFTLLRTIDDNSFNGNLSLQLGLSGQDNKLEKIYDKGTNNTGIGFSLEVPIWDWGRRKAKIRSSELSIESKNLLFEDQKRDIELTIRKLHRSILSLYHQVENAKLTVEKAQLTYDTNLERFKKGQISGMDLQLFQNQLSQKKMAETNAIINYKLELLNLKIQTLYDWEKGVEFVPEGLVDNK